MKELRSDNERAMKNESAIRQELEEKQKELEVADLNLYFAR